MTGTPEHMTETPNPHAVLSEVLRRVRLASAVFLRGEFAAPWAFVSATSQVLAQVVAPAARRLVLMHVAVEGAFRITLDTGETAEVRQGEAVVLPYCDVHTMGYPELAAPVPIVELLPMPPWTELPVTARIDGGGAPSRVMCGYLHCDDMLFDPLLRALPRLIHVPAAAGPAAQWREASVRYALEAAAKPGASELCARIPELVLIDCLEQYAASLTVDRAGWLGALRDPVVGRALALMHAQPTEDWTVEGLAQRLAVSRSVFADRFTQLIGLPPMKYLAQWRLQLAADLVRTTELGIAEIAGRVGYDSEAAFSRAFKRQFGASPASWRGDPTD
jgi:AraC family transcriptional regulator, alkane utilization regulator